MQILISILFILGFIVIAFEEVININKAASALFVAILSWIILFFNDNHPEHVGMIMGEHLGGISGIVFFLLGAMTIVEIIDGHDGFYEVSKIINTKNKMTFVFMVAILSFFISSILDNLTASIVMVSIVNKLLEDKSQKWYISGLIIISANAGGVWSPIGDVTTTMLWMGGQIETLAIIKSAFIPSLISMLVTVLLIHFKIKGELTIKSKELQNEISVLPKNERISVLFLGIFSFMLVPVLKATLHIPPFAGMLFALSVMWLITSFMHKKKTIEIKNTFSVQSALQRIDTLSILFFLGILMNISALEFAGILDLMASKMTNFITHPVIITSAIGLVSSIVDNVPLVAATQKMFTLSQYPVNHYFWILLAYTAGTGGSCLIIGSAAGVGVMGVQKISFGWYLRHISWIALVSFFAGMLYFFFQGSLL